MRNSLPDARHFAPLLLLGTFLTSACNDGSPSDPPPSDSLVATTVQANSGTLLSAMVDSAVADVPSVLVADQHGDPLAGVSVTFAVTSGGGALSDDHPVTDTLGVARVGAWHLGPTPGPNGVTATVAGLTPVSFSAMALPRPVPCTTWDTLPFNSPLAGNLQAGNCLSASGGYLDLYQVDFGELAFAYKVRLLSSAFDAFAFAYDSLHRPVGFNDDSLTGYIQNSIFSLLVPPGPYFVGASSYNPGDTGAYTLSVIPASGQNDYCIRMFTVPGVHTNQNLLDTDCPEDNGRLYGDVFWIHLDSAQSITVLDTAPNFDALLGLYDGTTLHLLAENDDASASTLNSRLPFTAPAAGYYVILATSATDTTKGFYALTIAPGIVAGAPPSRSASTTAKPGAALPAELTVRPARTRRPS